MNYNDTVEKDHFACIIDADVEEYFKEEFIGWGNVNWVALNPAKRSHCNSFVKSIEEQLDMHLLENNLRVISKFATY